jgi:GMP synthase (glutamine-hydrolysing)
MRKKTIRKVVIIKAGETFPVLSERRGDFEDWIQAPLGIEPEKIHLVKAYRGEDLPDPRQVDGVVITGSNAMVTDRAEWSENLAAWLPSAIEAGIPLLGICYGHHLLAHALGATVGPNPLGGEMGTVEIQLTESATIDPLFKDHTSVIQVQVSHFQSVLTHPDGATLLASSVRDPHFAFSYGKSAWGIQFHPEFDADIVRTYIDLYSEQLRTNGLDPSELHKTVTETPYGRSFLERFGEIVRGKGTKRSE